MNVHQNARLTPFRRRELVMRLEQGEAVSSVARQLGISVRTAHKWRGRFGRDGVSGLYDRSSRPTGTLVSRRPLLRWASRCCGSSGGPAVRSARRSASAAPPRPAFCGARVCRAAAGSSRRRPFNGTSIHARASCCMSTPRNSAGSPASAIVSSAAHRASTARRALAGSTCTSPLTTTRAWRTSNCCPMIGQSPSGRFSVARCGGFERAVSGCGACYPTMAPVTARQASARRVAHCMSSTAARVRILRGRTAKPNASFRARCANGHMLGRTTPRPIARVYFPAGWSTTIAPVPMPASLGCPR
jgi:transposase-like protein